MTRNGPQIKVFKAASLLPATLDCLSDPEATLARTRQLVASLGLTALELRIAASKARVAVAVREAAFHRAMVHELGQLLERQRQQQAGGGGSGGGGPGGGGGPEGDEVEIR